MPLVKVLHHDLPSAVTLAVSDFIHAPAASPRRSVTDPLVPEGLRVESVVRRYRSGLGPLVGGLFGFCDGCVGGGGPAGQESQGFLVGCVGFGGEHVEP